MFWKCEQWPENAWTKQDLVSIVNELLLNYVEWLNNRQCANYFIPEYNMWDHVKDGRCFDEAISLIVETVESGSVQVCLQNCPVPEESETFEFDQLNEETKYFMYQTCWYAASCFGYLPISNTFHSPQSYGKDSEEYVKLCEGLAWNIRWRSDNENTEQFYNQASNCFVHASNLPGNLEMFCLPRAVLNMSITEIVEIAFHSRSSSSSTVSIKSSSSNGESNSFCKDKVILCNRLFRYFLTGVPSALHFISRAYLVNMSYMRGHDYRHVIDLCDESIKYLEQTAHDSPRDAREGAFRLPLNIEWCAIYDPQIRSILGFISLARHFVTNRPPQVVAVCPILFILYFRMKCYQELKEPTDFLPLFRHVEDCSFNNLCGQVIFFLAYRMNEKLYSVFVEKSHLKYSQLSRCMVLSS